MIKGLSRDAFVCSARYKAELREIFGNWWVPVATVQQLDAGTADPKGCSTYLTVEIGEYSIVVTRTNQQVAAYHNVCRHRGTRLLDNDSGTLKNDCVTCPYHAWSYKADDGRLVGAPNMTEVEDFDRGEFGLLPVACQAWAGIVFVNLSVAATDSDEPKKDFQRQMGPLLNRVQNWRLDDLVIAESIEYDVAANWKLIFQNYSECYHCPTVHPDLNTQTPYKSATNDLEEGPILGGPMQLADGFETVSDDGRAVGPMFPGLTAEQARSIYYYTIFPGLFVSAHPDYVMIHCLQPTAIGRTSVRCHFLVAGGTPVASLRKATSMWDTINQQDWRVCELTQRGVASPAFQPGPYSNLEPMLAAFDRFYRKTMALE